MKLPNPEQAVIDFRKLEDYCLNPDHPRGKHKAKVFKSTLGITQIDAAELKSKIREGIFEENCKLGDCDEYGQRYIMDFQWSRRGRKAAIRTSWIVKASEKYPRLTSCYIL